MIETDVLVIGGSAGGILTALSAKKTYRDKKVTVVRMTEKVMVPCGIPYIFGTLKDTSKNVIADTMLTNAGIDIIIDEVVSIDRENKKVNAKKSGEISYKKLILATGSLPIVPTFIPGHDLENVLTIKKDEEYLKFVQQKINEAQDIVVIGGGFIGVEMAEQVQLLGKNVTIIEVADKLLWQAFDPEYSDMVEATLKDHGITVKTNTKVTKLVGDTKVKEVELDTGEKIKADVVILAMGVKPNTKLAEEAGIKLNERGAIVVDEYMRTNDPDIFAVGDCAEKKCFFTRKNVPILLASTAANEAKIAGVNVFQLRLVRENKGTISAFSTKIYNTAFAAAGLTETQAKAEGFDIVIGEFSTMDKHPGTLPNAKSVKIKLIFSRYSGVILGAQIAGGENVGEMINILSLAIQKGTTASELNTFQVATHPLLTSSPVSYPINSAALDAMSKI
ncbi:FAD-dependent oxidoreductase [Thermoanaerobacter brockii subsp. lactiethylicus]